MSWLKIEEIASNVNSGKSSALDMVNEALKRISNAQEFKSIISTTEERAVERAKDIDSLVKNGKNAGRLAGVPFIAKDNFLTYGGKTTAASNMLKDFNAPYQATVISRLEAEGAICVAKANLDAFAHGSSTENSDFMTTKHPTHPDRVPGGSSGGSAAAVMLDLAPFSLGTDTGGSIRLPASFTGAVGLKPSYGLVPRYGVIAMASSTDVIGPIAKNVDDVSIVLDVIAGKDILDSTTIEREKCYNPTAPLDLKGVKVGVVKEYLEEGIDEEVKEVILGSLAKIAAAGAEIEEVSLPSLPLALAVYYVICPAEVSSNLSRYDGIKYGHVTGTADSLQESYAKSRAEGFGDEAKRRIMIGTYVLSSGYYDAYYKKAALVRTKLINEFDNAFNKYDFLVGPTAPVTAFKAGENIDDPLKMYLIDIMTVAANLTGIASISIPAGKAEGLPVGLQIMANRKKDNSLLEFSKAFEEIAK